MGAGSSTNKPLQTETENDDGEIDVNTLFQALLKLSCVFEVKDSLKRSLTDEITDPKHTSFDAQFFAVEEWIKKYGDADLTPQEMYYLIKYVELYEPLPENNKSSVSETNVDSSLVKHPSCESEGSDHACPLTLPYRSGMAAWTAEIRSEELKKIIFKDDETLRFDSFEYNHRNGDGCVSGRPRFDSNVSDLSM